MTGMTTRRAPRGLSEGFRAELERLVTAPGGGWWRDVLTHPGLFVFVREDYLNVYSCGASIFRVEHAGGEAVPVTHSRYLVRNRQAYVPLRPDGSFGLDPEATLWTRFREGETLREMIVAAQAHAGPEKIGVHALLRSSPHVVDLEIVLPRSASAVPEVAADDTDDDPGLGASIAAAEAEERATTLLTSPAPAGLVLDRLDAASLSEAEDGTISLVFHEAKHFQNRELRAKGDEVPVVAQIRQYERTIRALPEGDLAAEYRAVCRDLLSIEAMRARLHARTRGPKEERALDLIRRVAEGAPLRVDPRPVLVVFGFDDDQRRGKVWTEHLAKLRAALGDGRVHAVGNARGASAAFR